MSSSLLGGGFMAVGSLGWLRPEANDLLERGQEVRHLIFAPEPRSAVASDLADLGRVFLSQSTRAVKRVTPLLRRNAGSLEDVEGSRDRRGERRLVAELQGE